VGLQIEAKGHAGQGMRSRASAGAGPSAGGGVTRAHV
jgi:hypothetical protein